MNLARFFTMPYPSDNAKKENNKFTDKRNTTVNT